MLFEERTERISDEGAHRYIPKWGTTRPPTEWGLRYLYTILNNVVKKFQSKKINHYFLHHIWSIKNSTCTFESMLCYVSSMLIDTYIV